MLLTVDDFMFYMSLSCPEDHRINSLDQPI